MNSCSRKEGYILTLSLKKLNTAVCETSSPENLFQHIAALNKTIFKLSREFPCECIKKGGSVIQWFYDGIRLNGDHTPPFRKMVYNLNSEILSFRHAGQKNPAVPSFGLCFGEVFRQKKRFPHFNKNLLLSEAADLSQKFAHERNNSGFTLLMDAHSREIFPGSRIVDGYRTPGFTELKIMYGNNLETDNPEIDTEEGYIAIEKILTAALEALFLDEIAKADELLKACLAAYPDCRTAEAILNRLRAGKKLFPLRSYHISWL